MSSCGAQEILNPESPINDKILDAFSKNLSELLEKSNSYNKEDVITAFNNSHGYSSKANLGLIARYLDKFLSIFILSTNHTDEKRQRLKEIREELLDSDLFDKAPEDFHMILHGMRRLCSGAKNQSELCEFLREFAKLTTRQEEKLPKKSILRTVYRYYSAATAFLSPLAIFVKFPKVDVLAYLKLFLESVS